MKHIKPTLLGALIMFVAMLGYHILYNQLRDNNDLESQAVLLKEKVSQVRKLVVTQAQYASVYTYENTTSYGWDFFKSKKSAVVLSNAQVQIVYDLKEVQFEVQQQHKSIRITQIPEPEINIQPGLEFYDLNDGILNKFNATDLNKIKKDITQQVYQKVTNSQLKENAHDRLLTELSHLYNLSNSMGWTIIYDGSPVKEQADFIH